MVERKPVDDLRETFQHFKGNEKNYAKFICKFVVKQIGKYAAILPIGENDYNGIITLNSTAALFVTKLLNHSIEDSIALYRDYYHLSTEQAYRDCNHILDALTHGGFILELY